MSDRARPGNETSGVQKARLAREALNSTKHLTLRDTQVFHRRLENCQQLPKDDCGHRYRWDPKTHRQGIEVVGVDDVEPGDVLLRLSERAVGHDHVAVIRADDSGRIGIMKCAPE